MPLVPLPGASAALEEGPATVACTSEHSGLGGLWGGGEGSWDGGGGGVSHVRTASVFRRLILPLKGNKLVGLVGVKEDWGKGGGGW